MHRCEVCGEHFATPYVGEMEEETGYTPVTCPHCGSCDFEEVYICPCGNPVAGKLETYCEDCKEQVKLTLNKLKEDLGFSQDEFEDIIADYFNW